MELGAGRRASGHLFKLKQLDPNMILPINKLPGTIRLSVRSSSLVYSTFLLLFASFLKGAGIIADPIVLAKVEQAWEVADSQAQRTLAYLEAIQPRGIYYPQHTENESLRDTADYAHGEWVVRDERSGFWAKGSWPGILFLLADREQDALKRDLLIEAAVDYATPLLGTRSSDMAVNSLFVLRTWLQLTDDLAERTALSADILRGARLLAEPYVREGDTGRFHMDLGIMGYNRKARYTDGEEYFHAFIDHTPNVEQLIYAAGLTADPLEAEDLVDKAISHVVNLGQTFGANRNPGDRGTWQRGFWDWDESSPTYGQFLFNEAKQGHDHHTTWSRGQAWFVYGSSVAYAYTRDPSLLPYVKEQIDYYLANLPDRFPGELARPGKMIPPWDFDYALYGDTDPANPNFGIPQVDTEVDTSAAAMAVAGILQLVATLPEEDPDRQRYLEDAEATLLELCSDAYLCGADDPEMSILRRGCYHHSECMQYPGPNKDNGLIWGDFFFVWAMWCYLDLSEDKEEFLDSPQIVLGPPRMVSYDRPRGSLPFGFQIETSKDLSSWEPIPTIFEAITPGGDGTETVEIVIEPDAENLGDRAFFKLRR
jgi:hypothetical protein